MQHNPPPVFFADGKNLAQFHTIKKMLSNIQTFAATDKITFQQTQTRVCALQDNLLAAFACFCVHVLLVHPERSCLPAAKLPLTFAVMIKV